MDARWSPGPSDAFPSPKNVQKQRQRHGRVVPSFWENRRLLFGSEWPSRIATDNLLSVLIRSGHWADDVAP
jgi:hypothetical protein